MSDVHDQVASSEELVAIVIRASQLGFNAARVATALGIPADGLARIQQRVDASAFTRKTVSESLGTSRAQGRW